MHINITGYKMSENELSFILLWHLYQANTKFGPLWRLVTCSSFKAGEIYMTLYGPCQANDENNVFLGRLPPSHYTGSTVNTEHYTGLSSFWSTCIQRWCLMSIIPENSVSAEAQLWRSRNSLLPGPQSRSLQAARLMVYPANHSSCWYVLH